MSKYDAAMEADRAFADAVARQFPGKQVGDYRYLTHLHNAETRAAGLAKELADRNLWLK